MFMISRMHRFDHSIDFGSAGGTTPGARKGPPHRGKTGTAGDEAREGKKLRRRGGCALAALAAAYVLLYACRFVQVNREVDRAYLMASELPEECRAGVELYGDPPETVGAWVTREDIDGDGEAEWIVDAGDYGRGAGNSWYNIWKQRADGTFADIGGFYCDEHWAVPKPWIFGHPGILCVESRGFTEWVDWKNGRYAGRGEAGTEPSPRE